MKRYKFAKELIISLFVSGLCSSATALILVFIFGNLSLLEQFGPAINMTSGVIFGVIFGFRLNSLFVEVNK